MNLNINTLIWLSSLSPWSEAECDWLRMITIISKASAQLNQLSSGNLFSQTGHPQQLITLHQHNSFNQTWITNTHTSPSVELLKYWEIFDFFFSDWVDIVMSKLWYLDSNVWCMLCWCWQYHSTFITDKHISLLFHHHHRYLRTTLLLLLTAQWSVSILCERVSGADTGHNISTETLQISSYADK